MNQAICQGCIETQARLAALRGRVDQLVDLTLRQYEAIQELKGEPKGGQQLNRESLRRVLVADER